MLIALFSLYLLTAGEVDGAQAQQAFIASSRDSIELLVDESDAQSKALAILDAMAVKAESYSTHTKRVSEELSKLIRDRDTPAAELSAILENNREFTEAYSGEVLDLRFSLRDSLSREDWQKIYGESSAEITPRR